MSRLFTPSKGPQARSYRLPPLDASNNQARSATPPRSWSAESTTRPPRRRESQDPSTWEGNNPGFADAQKKLTEQVQLLTTEVYRLAKHNTQEGIERLAQQLHSKSRVVDTLVEDHRRINQDLQAINDELSVSRTEHQNVSKNLDAVVEHVNSKMTSLASLVSKVSETHPQAPVGSGSHSQAAVEVAASRELLSEVVRAQHEQASGTAAVSQREARKSAILFSAVVQVGQLLDVLRRDVSNNLAALHKTMDQRLGFGDDNASQDPNAYRAASAQELQALESRLRSMMHVTSADTLATVSAAQSSALEEVGRQHESERHRVNGIGVEAQKLKVQLQLESQQRKALEVTHQEWLSQLRQGLVASGEEAGSRIAQALVRVEEATSATRVAAQQAVDEQREQLLAELERRAGELRSVESGLANSLREAEERLISKIAARQTAAETNAHRLVQRCDTLETEVRTITDAMTRSLSGLKDTHTRRLDSVERVIEAEIASRQKEHNATKARLEGVVASITRAIDAIQENSAADLVEVGDRIMQTATALNMSAQQGRQQMQREIDEDMGRVCDRLEAVEATIEGLEDNEAKEVQGVMDRLIFSVELQHAQAHGEELEKEVHDLQAELTTEREARKRLEKNVNELLEKQHAERQHEDLDWKATVGAATAWLQQAAANHEDGNKSDSPPAAAKQKPRVRVRADIFGNE